ncbi:tRNA-specific 2-thiouridylase [Mytilus galloprovincialis]|uniref:tRNA-5-taurinomethyluridine 2-sulfurtransferase n=1 Tax=Mytilus galloprovincialis TaxID=29158 RepID=A0A8B6G8D5_MYTGA|nr:tRNA-specific 2-thiouridylase [Mytilus galloprovincialis]
MRTGLKKIVCGMSGGVDSSVAAYMLKKRGHEVIGLFMKNWDIADEKGKCSSDADREDAQYVCDRLQIPLQDVNFVKEYWNEVFSTLIKGYENGYTPNPDVLCNQHIKFKHFFDHAIDNIGADAIATGHYVKTSVFENLEQPNTSEGIKLMLPLDQWKDQTLFLSQIPQRALQKSVFPLGDILKKDVKKIAESIGLDRIAKKKESMGICFIGKRNFQSFVEQYIEQKPGNFVDVETGEIVGTHKGAHYWTIGQRTHLSGLDKAYFVSSFDITSQTVYVAKGTDHPALFFETLFTEPVHWIHRPPRDLIQNQMCDVGFRYQHVHPISPCTLTLSGGNSLIVSLAQPMRSIAAGQYAVFYKDNECLGSARILRTGPSLYVLNYKDRVKIAKGFS